MLVTIKYFLGLKSDNVILSFNNEITLSSSKNLYMLFTMVL